VFKNYLFREIDSCVISRKSTAACPVPRRRWKRRTIPQSPSYALPGELEIDFYRATLC